MKVSSSSIASFVLLVATTAATTVAAQESYPQRTLQAGSPQARRLLQNARRVNQYNDDAGGDDGGNAKGDDQYNAEGVAEVEDELQNYSLKLMKCQAEASLDSGNNNNYNNNDNNGDDDNAAYQKKYGVAIIRACPRNSCSENTQGGCKSGYADFAVPLTDFVSAYLYDQAQNMQWALEDDSLTLDTVGECVKYNQKDNNGNSYYVGPACTSNGKDIKLSLFKDAYCQKSASEKTFEELSNGVSLPYHRGGLVSKQCLACGENDGNGDYALKEMCAELYEDAALKCEEWDINHYYWDAITEVYRFGKDTTGCKRIGWMDKTPEPFGEWASIFALLFLVAGSAAGAVWYTMWWKNRKFQCMVMVGCCDETKNRSI